MTNQQLSNLPDEKIRAMAHKIWLARQESGNPGNADNDWQAAVNAFTAEMNNPTTTKSGLTQWYWLGLVALLSSVAFVVSAKLGLF